MTEELKKILGVIASFVWLGITGLISLAGFFFALEAPESKWAEIQLPFVLFYLLVGTVPVLGLVILLKKLDLPLGQVTLIGLGIFGVLPIILFVISYLLS